MNDVLTLKFEKELGSEILKLIDNKAFLPMYVSRKRDNPAVFEAVAKDAQNANKPSHWFATAMAPKNWGATIRVWKKNLEKGITASMARAGKIGQKVAQKINEKYRKAESRFKGYSNFNRDQYKKKEVYKPAGGLSAKSSIDSSVIAAAQAMRERLNAER